MALVWNHHAIGTVLYIKPHLNLNNYRVYTIYLI